MRTVYLSHKRTLAECDELLGTKVNVLCPFGYIFNEDVRLIDEQTQEVVAVLLKRAIPARQLIDAFRVFDALHITSSNRGNATDKTKTGFRPKKDGTRGRTRVSLDPRLPENGIIGYFDRTVRFPYCRQTTFVRDQLEEFTKLLPFFSIVSERFREQLPTQWGNQRSAWEATAPDFRIPHSVFTTVTVNKNFQTAIHQDVGDLKEGFSCLAVMRSGVYTGGEFYLPRWGAALNIESGDLALINPHAHHGNLPIEKVTKGSQRISCVMYFRTKMTECGTAEEELKRAKERKPGDALYDPEPITKHARGSDDDEK